jgi:hypothetical protein
MVEVKVKFGTRRQYKAYSRDICASARDFSLPLSAIRAGTLWLLYLHARGMEYKASQRDMLSGSQQCKVFELK